MTKFKKEQSVFVINAQQVKVLTITEIDTTKTPTKYTLNNGSKYSEDEIGTTKNELKDIFFG